MSTTAVSSAPSGSRSRTQTRKKVNDDGTYFGSGGGSAGTKRRHEGAEVDGRVKRKRIASSVDGSGVRKAGEGDTGVNLVEFSSLPLTTIYRYLAQYELIPSVVPSPLTAYDPPAPATLDHAANMNNFGYAQSPGPPGNNIGTGGSRPRREKDPSRRRSSRRVEDEMESRTPMLADVGDIHGVLSGIAERHFREEMKLKEVDTLVQFMLAIKGGPY